MWEFLDIKRIKKNKANFIIKTCPKCGQPMRKEAREINGPWGNTNTKRFFLCPKCGYQKEAKFSKSPTFD
ncbi:MAG: hypothetical protein GWO87_00190 [Xanthomonadaceae bacterium]|nr:hypothetical protein [Rhodospirillaceae bacterium]NIA17599.1 hypothetical protein [Xanthomonadaceae bacterium]